MRGGNIVPVSTQTGEQSDFLKKMFESMGVPFEQGMQYLQGILGGGDEAFRDFEAPMMRQYNEQIVPGIAARFSGMGAGSQASSAFPQALSQSAADLTERLSSQRAGLKTDALSKLFGMAQTGLGTQAFQNVQMPGKTGLMDTIMPGIGSMIGMGVGGPVGGAMGGGLEALIRKIFSGRQQQQQPQQQPQQRGWY